MHGQAIVMEELHSATWYWNSAQQLLKEWNVDKGRQ
jgi:hypothetical protein